MRYESNREGKQYVISIQNVLNSPNKFRRENNKMV